MKKYINPNLCRSHYDQRRKGLTLTPLRFQNKGKLCSVPECGKAADSLGKCVGHYTRYVKGSTSTSPLKTYGAVVRNEEGQKRCTLCTKWSSPDEFYLDRYTPDGLATQCISCSKSYRNLERERQRSRLRRFKLTQKDYLDLWEVQERRCATCKESSEVRLTVDHDHACCNHHRTCGRCVRGLLCGKCNAALGAVQDDERVLKAFIGYLCLKRSNRIVTKPTDTSGYSKLELSRLRKYQISKADFDFLWAQQGYRCATCLKSDVGLRGWSLDHDHQCCPDTPTCGKCTRGVLCNSCNLALGLLCDSSATLTNMIEYLNNYETRRLHDRT